MKLIKLINEQQDLDKQIHNAFKNINDFRKIDINSQKNLKKIMTGLINYALKNGISQNMANKIMYQYDSKRMEKSFEKIFNK